MRTFLLFIFITTAFGCKSVVLYKDGATQSDYSADMNQCDYEATSATQQTDYSLNTMFGQELDRAQRKKDLILRCMKAKGWEPK